jgi:hypothetical protein
VRIAPVLSALLAVSIACGGSAPSGPCDPVDPVLANSSFVLVVAPTPGMRAPSPIQVRGCSRTFESNVVWELRARDGRVLGSGHTSGGGVDGAATFSFSVDFAVSVPEVGHLVVFEPDESDGEGFPGGRSVIPLILLPGSG